VSLNYESVFSKRVAAVAGSHYVLLSLTTINHAVDYLLSSDWYTDNISLSRLFTSLLVYSAAWVAFLLFKNIKKSDVNLNRIWLPFIFFPITSTFLELLQLVINQSAVLIVVNVFNALGVILIFFYLYNVVSKTFEETLKTALHSQEREYYFTQCQLMQESMEKVKSIRHDMKLHLATLRDYAADNKAVTDYLNSLLENIEDSEVYSNTGNIAFDSIINFKLKNAKADNIEPCISITVQQKINVEVADIVTILGNLLDNSLEAVSKTTDKNIKLDIELDKGGLFIKIENSFDGETKYAETKGDEEKQIVSLKGGKHGYGLKNVRKSLEKYNGYMKITHTENIFSVGVFLYVDEPTT
jgi:sensor histidine kinase YesM